MNIKVKGSDKAELKALLNQRKPFSLQRLMHDYNEIKNQKIPIPGVSALPLDDNFYEWHGNIKSSTTNVYKGAVLHFRINFPRDYPLSPPKFYVMNPGFKHPNVMPDNHICIDIFEKKRDPYKGWKSGYTVLTMLLQLQVFFFDVDENYLEKADKELIKNQVLEMSEYACPSCKHKGSSNPYPELPKITPENSKLTQEQYKELKKNEICCYHRKTTFQESPLGLGVSISKIPRTGEIKGITPCFDYISLKSFTKEKLRVAFNGEKFTHWFPLYFGEKETEFMKILTKTISMIAKGNTKEFSVDLINKVMPKFFNYICLNILSEKVHNSSRSIQVMISIFRILILLKKAYPEYKSEVNKAVNDFISDEKNRIKEKTPSLADLLCMVAISDYKLEEILPSYLSEQLDRQIFWILQELPEFEKLINSSEVDDIRAKICFKSGLVGKHLLLFYYYFIKKIIYKDCDTLEKFANKLDTNFSNLTDEEIDIHRKEISKILKIDNFNDFYQYLGMSVPTKNEMNDKLKQSFINSKEKGYHGTDEVRFVPNETEQAKYYMKKYLPIDSLLKEGKELLSEEDPKWKDALNSFDIINQFKYYNPNEELTPLNIVTFERKYLHEKLFFDEAFSTVFTKEGKNKGKIGSQINKRKFVKKYKDEELLKKLTWRQLYLKLYLEEYCKYFPYLTDFKELYKILEIVNKDIIHFSFVISNCKLLKSDFNYVRAVLSKLTSLKYLEFIFTDNINIKLLKNITKGIANALKDKAAIEHLKIVTSKKQNNYSTKELNILTILDNLPSLKILDVKDMKISLNEILRIRNHLYYYKKISVLDLSNTGLNDQMCNELADGIMKAKGLEELYLSKNNTTKGVASILYNLAFQPSIKIIDISYSTCTTFDVSTSLHKFIKMSQTVEYIIANNINGLNNAFTTEFYSAIGDSNSLQYLDLSNSGNFSNNNSLGLAIGFNAKKNGSLIYLDVSSCFKSFEDFKSFINSMKVSENEHNQWYGFQFNSNIAKDSPEYYSKEFNCNLKSLILNYSNLFCSTNYLDPKNSKLENPLTTLLSKSNQLDTLILDSISQNKYFLECFAEALHSKNNLKYLSLNSCGIDGERFKSFLPAFYESIPQDNKEKNEKEKKEKNENIPKTANPAFHIEELDISNNKLGYSGIETISQALKINKTIKSLNLFHNLCDVNGARRISEVLKINSTLVELDIGYNRIKNVGFRSIIKGIKENKNSRIKYLGVKYNFIKNDTFEEALKIIEENKEIQLEKIDIKNNNIKLKFLSDCWENQFNKMTRKIKVDVFDVLYFLEPERLEKTIYIPTAKNITPSTILNQIKQTENLTIRNEKSHIGIPIYMRIIRGKKTGKKKDSNSADMFIEFIMPNSCNRMLKIGGTGGFRCSGRKTRVYKAGTQPDYLVVKGKRTGR